MTSVPETQSQSVPESGKASCSDGAPPPGGQRARLVDQRFDVPVQIDEALCIDGCTLCVEVCPLDALAIDPVTNKAYMHVDECWYCGPCADRCPTGAVTVNIPYLLR